MKHQQAHRRALPGVQTETARLERSLALAFVNTTSALARRPEPRHRFDNAARRDNATRPWADFAEPLRDVARDAAMVGGPVAQQTEERIVDAVIALLDYVTAPLRPEAGAVSYLAVAREVPEAIDWIARAKFHPSRENLARAAAEEADACSALEIHRGMLRRTLDFPRPLGAPPLEMA